MSRWMDGWMDGWMDRCVPRSVCKSVRKPVHMPVCMYANVHICTCLGHGPRGMRLCRWHAKTLSWAAKCPSVCFQFVRARARRRRPRLRRARAVDLPVEAPRVALALGEGLEVLARRDGHGRGAESRAQAAEAVRRVREARRQQHELVVHLRVEHREQEAGGDADRGPRRRRAEAHRSAAFTPPASRASLVHNFWATIVAARKIVCCTLQHTRSQRAPPAASEPARSDRSPPTHRRGGGRY